MLLWRKRLVLLWWRRLTISALHSFSLIACLTGSCTTKRRGDRLPKSRWHRGWALLTFGRTQRRRRAEPYAFIITLWRSLSCPTTRGVWRRSWASHWLATMFLLLRWCIL